MMLVMLVIVTSARTFFIVVMMLVMLVIVASARTFFIVVMMLVHHFLQLRLKTALMNDGIQYLFAAQLFPRGGDQIGKRIFVTDNVNGTTQLFLRNIRGTAENDGRGIFQLIIIKFAEILSVDLTLRGVCHGYRRTQLSSLTQCIFDRTDNVTEFADSTGLNEYTVGRKLVQHLGERFGKITHQRAADTTRVHLGDLHTALLQKAAIYTDLTKLIFNENQFFAAIGFSDQLFNQRGLTCAQKT